MAILLVDPLFIELATGSSLPTPIHGFPGQAVILEGSEAETTHFSLCGANDTRPAEEKRDTRAY